LGYYSPQCYGSQEAGKNIAIVVTLKNDSVVSSNDYSSALFYSSSVPSGSKYYFEDTKVHEGIKCATYSSIDYDDSVGTNYTIYSKADLNNADLNTNKYPSIGLKFQVVRTETMQLCDVVPNPPSNTVVDGLNFKSNLDSSSSCESMFNDSGDGIGFNFINPSSTPSTCPTGHCYFNTPLESPCNLPSSPSEMIVNNFNFQDNYDSFSSCENAFYNNGDGVGFSFVNPTNCTSGHCYYNVSTETTPTDNTTNNDNNTTTGTADIVNNISELIPYVDDLEDINRDIITSINNNKASTDNVVSSIENTQSTLNNILESINNISSSTTTDNTSDNSSETELNNISNSDLATNDTNLNNAMESFTTDYTEILDTSFINYSDVFGFGGYGSAPAPISFNLIGTNYILFDIQYLNSYIDHIRTIFIIFGYLFGIFIFFRSV